MAKRNTKRGAPSAGRTTLTPCRYLDDDRVCEPLNSVWLLDGVGKVTKRYGACTCGRRFGPAEVPKELPPGAVDFLAEDPPSAMGMGGPLPATRLDEAAMADVVAGLWPVERTHAWARDGVVPVGEPVMHEATAAVDPAAPSAVALGERLLATQEAAEGVGLAANQVGAPVQALAHNFPRIAPQIFLNPTLLSSEGVWEYEEGCLSLHVEDTPADVLRPKIIVVHAELLDGTQLIARADELFARVLQHELDHLDGIEYVQRLIGRTARRVYRTMDKAGIDTERWLPPHPY